MSKKEKEDIPEIDETLLTPEQKAEMDTKHLTRGWIIFFGVMFALILACIIVIIVLPKN